MDTLRWTTRDLELMPEDGNRYEIVDGELYVSKQPDLYHQIVCSKDETNVLETPLLAGFGCKVGNLFTSVLQ